MALGMFSLAGVPPLVGFYAKLSVIDALISAQGLEYLSLAIFAVLISLVGAFYYLRVVKVMYFDEPLQTAPVLQSPRLSGLLALNGAAVLVLGPLSGGLLEWCRTAIVTVLGA
jgi:NADH-quinone oxidoreductase subunit N